MSNYIFKIKKFDTDGNRTDSLIKGEFAQFDVVGDEDRGRTYVQTSIGPKAFAWKSETDQLRLDVSASLGSKSGYTTDTLPEDRWLEGSTPNTITDIVQDSYIIDGVAHEGGVDRDLVLPEAPFEGADDELLATGTTLSSPKALADFVITGDTDTIYQCISDSAGTDLTNTSQYRILDFVTRLDVIYRTATEYKTFKGYHGFTDKELTEGGSDLIASRYGFTKISEGCYEINGEKATCLQVSGARLNAKMYNDFYNPLGSFKNSSDEFWYEEVTQKTSIYDTFSQAVNSTSGRPDSKIHTDIYIKGENGLASHSTFYSKDSESGIDRGLAGISSGSGTYWSASSASLRGSTTVQLWSDGPLDNSPFPFVGDGVTDKLLVIWLNGKEIKVHCRLDPDGTIEVTSTVVGKPIDGQTYTYDEFRAEVNAAGGNYNYITVGAIKIVKKQPLLLSYGESLMTDGFQDQADWPSEWKSYLAGGGVTSLNPALIDEAGVSTIPNGIKTVFKMTTKMKENHEVLASSDNGATWIAGTTKYTSATIDYVGNTVTFGVAPAVGDIFIVSSTSHYSPYTQIDPTSITKVLRIHEVVYSGDSYAVESNNLVLNQVSNIIQTGNNEIVKSLPITAIDNVTGVFDYIDDATTTTPTFVKFDATLTDGGRAECIWGSANGAIDKTNVYARRY